MKLKPDYNTPEATIGYKLDTKDGSFAESAMPATVAEEIAQRAESVKVGGEKGFEIVVNGEMMFPAKAFDFDDGELEALSKPRKAARADDAKGGSEQPARS